MKSALPRAIVVIFCLLATRLAFADILTGTAVRIADGDTITVQGNSGREIEVRLQGIDAPEHNQAFGEEATANLARLVSGKTVTLDCNGEQTYGRWVCKVLLPNGEDVDLDQVKAGCAWHYKQYAFSQSEDDQAKYGAAEDSAREARLGLWADTNPAQPQDFRHGTQSRLCFDPPEHRIMCAYNGPVRGNRRSHIYHWPGCRNYDDIADYNRVEFPNRQAAEAEGFRAARNCP
jgi:endonuclease YncB( thermonuclease family)